MLKFFRRIRQQILPEFLPQQLPRAEVDRVIELNATLLKHPHGLAAYTGAELPDITEEEFEVFFVEPLIMKQNEDGAI